MFVLGAVLASAVVMLVLNRKSTPESPETPVATVVTPLPESPAAPLADAEPEPSKHSGFGTVEPKPAKHPRATATSSKPATPAASSPAATQTSPAQPAQQSTTTTTPQVGGPPQTTISMPPAPDGSKPAADIKDTKPPAPARVPKTVTIPVGTLLTVRVDDAMSTNTVHTGDSFRATLDQALTVDGAVIAERGARVEGRVAESDRGGKVSGNATLALELVRLNTSDGQRVRLQTQGFKKVAEKGTKKDAAKIGIGAGLGAAIGAIAGGGKGAAIGAGVGGAAGTGAVMATRGSAAEIAAETKLTFRLGESVTITEKID